jgi:hypothetical protein
MEAIKSNAKRQTEAMLMINPQHPGPVRLIRSENPMLCVRRNISEGAAMRRATLRIAGSTINFYGPDSSEQVSRFAVSSVDETLRPLPAGLQITVKLRSRISGDMAVSAFIEGAVVGNVTAKHAAAIPAGSPVRGASAWRSMQARSLPDRRIGVYRSRGAGHPAPFLCGPGRYGPGAGNRTDPDHEKHEDGAQQSVAVR